MEYNNKDKYEGFWFKGQRSGEGTYEYSNGDTYTGYWKGDSKNGHGVLQMATGDRYEGSWVDGKKNGPGNTIYFISGKYCFINGDLYDGMFCNGNR